MATSPNAPSRNPANPRHGCMICATLSPRQVLELDQLLGDPAMWPSTVFNLMGKPEGGLPASYRRYGAERVGREWLDSHGFEHIGKLPLRRHIRYDVVHVAKDPTDLIEIGLIARSKSHRLPTSPVIDRTAFITYFNSGIQVGAAAHQLLAEQINKLIDEDKPVPTSLLTKLAEMGSQFARTQAQLIARGVRFTEDDDEDEAFRGKPDDLPSPPIGGHTRIRTIDGERRPIADEGRKDREEYARRRADEGRDGID